MSSYHMGSRRKASVGNCCLGSTRDINQASRPRDNLQIQSGRELGWGWGVGMGGGGLLSML